MPQKFLILDDEPAVGRVLETMVTSIGLDSRFVSNAKDFFDTLAVWNPDYITLDLLMPNLDGVEVMRILGAQGCTARIIITSGLGTRVLDAARRSARQHGLSILGVLQKPILRSDLARLIQEGNETKAQPAPIPARTGPEPFVPTAHDLRLALERRELVAAYQPKIDCVTGALAGFEALARWQSPAHGLIYPDAFIPLAEEHGLIDMLTVQMFELGLEWLAHSFRESGITLSLNMSGKSLSDFHTAEDLLRLCNRFGISPTRIILELTETSAMVDPVVSLDLMTRFRVRGFRLSLDDFGTGFSSMKQLVRLPFSELKVDKSFIMTAMTSSESRTIARSIVDLGHSLGLTVTAEGVEDEGTLEFLRTLRCDFVQGYYIARPLTPERAAEWAARHAEQAGPLQPTPELVWTRRAGLAG